MMIVREFKLPSMKRCTPMSNAVMSLLLNFVFDGVENGRFHRV